MYELKRIRSAWAEISLDNLAHNVREVRRITNEKAEITAVIKADAYGHGAINVASALIENGISRFAVSILDEGIELRESGVKIPILILGYTDPQIADEVLKYDMEQTVYSLDVAEALSKEAVKQNKIAKIHIKIDTGMNRIGLKPDDEAVQLIKKICALPNIQLIGVYTHFASADETDKTYTRNQYRKFEEICETIECEGIDTGMKHCSNSAAVVDLLEMHSDMVRTGILLYGLAPSNDVQLSKLLLKQVMSLKVRISHVKEIEAGQCVSYGRKFTATKKTKVATLPIGYADGYTRMLSGKAEVLIKGYRAPIIGTICMDQCMADVTDIPDVCTGDEAVMFGEQDGNFISIDEVAAKLNTVNYEIVNMISKRIPRVYIKGGEIVNIHNSLYKI